MKHPELIRDALFRTSDSVFAMDMQTYLTKHDIVFQSPQIGGFEGLPLGNGDMAAMVWTDQRRVIMQINKADVWTQPTAESPMLLRSAGRVCVDFDCPVFDDIQLDQFEMRLSPATGILTLTADTPFAALDMGIRMFKHINGISVMLAGSGFSRVRLSIERYGSRGFPFWYNQIEKGAGKGLGNAQAGGAQLSYSERSALKRNGNLLERVLE